MPLSSVLGAQSLVRPGVCTSSTRPASPFEGQVIYETDTDLVQVYNGSGWKILGNLTASQTGSVLQVQSTTKTDTFSTTSTSFTDVTGLSVSITPKSTDSKVVIFVSMYGSLAVTAAYIQSALFRGTTQIALGDAASNRTRAFSGNYVDEIAQAFFLGGTFFDSPATTSATTYKMQIRTSNASNAAVIGRAGQDTDSTNFYRVPSTITVMEIAG